MLQNYYGDIAAIIMFVVVLAAAEIGYFAARRSRSRTINADAFKAVQTAMFPILGLLLAFTFSLALSRYDARRDAVVQEANAISTAASRADVLNTADRRLFRTALLSYAQIRLAFIGVTPEQDSGNYSLGAELNWQRLMWAVAVRAATSNDRPQLISLLLQSLNGVMDARALESAVSDAHIPDAILFILFAIAALTVGVAGFNVGLCGGRSIAFLMLALVLGLVTMAIVDLDRPQTGWTRVSLVPLQDVVWSIEDPQNPYGELRGSGVK